MRLCDSLVLWAWAAVTLVWVVAVAAMLALGEVWVGRRERR